MNIGKRAMDTTMMLESYFSDMVKAVLEESQLVISSIRDINEIFFQALVCNDNVEKNPELYILMDFIEIWQSESELAIKKMIGEGANSKNLFDQVNLVFWTMLLNLRKKRETFVCSLNQEEIPLAESILDIFSCSAKLRPSDIICRISLIRPEEVWKAIFQMRTCEILKPYISLDEVHPRKIRIQLTYALIKPNLRLQLKRSARRRVAKGKVVDIELARELRKPISLF